MATAAVLTDERRELVALVRDFAARNFSTPAQRSALSSDTDDAVALRDYNRTTGRLGWNGIAIDAAYGGGDGGLIDACVLMEALWYERLPVAGTLVSMIVGSTVGTFGTEAQKKDILGGICAGDVAAIAMSEPEAGSDVAALSCRAVPSGDGYIVNGQKTWISAAHYASRVLLLCRTESTGSKHQGISMLDVPLPSPGVEIRQINTLAGREVNEVFFTDAWVPRDRLVGVEGQAWGQLMAGLNFERLMGAAGFLGHARRIFDDTLEYVKQRHQFSRSLGSNQVVKHRLADLATEIECCNTLVYDVATRAEAAPELQLPREVSMAKLMTSEVSKRMAIEGMQLTGGMGYSMEFPMQEHLRHAMIATVYGGASEIQREIIAKSFGL